MFTGKLRAFQEDAKDFMLERKCALLAHSMGLGKTVSAIAVVEELVDRGEAQEILVLCPASIKWQWRRQIDKFSDGALAVVIEGTKQERTSQYRKVKRGDYEYVIMNYEQVVNDWDIVRHLNFDVIIADEVQALKSFAAKRSRHVKRLIAPYRFGLTGQPIENKPEELFSIMQWLDPSVLGRFDVFDKLFVVRNNFGGVKLYRNLPTLRKKMGTVMHRRTRDEIADQLPAIVENEYLIDFDPATRKAYQMIARDLLRAIQDAGPKYSSFDLVDHYSGTSNSGAGYAEIMPRLMALRMLCGHPKLLTISASNFDDPDSRLGSKYAAELRESGLLTGLKATPKMTATLEVIEEVLSEDPKNKVVLFSFFKPMLELISEKLKVGHVVFTGDLTPRERDEAIETFQNQKNCRVFLSSDAGGVGVDLPVGNTLINYDLPWSAGKFEQRQGRIIRLSSKWKSVTLLSMLMHNSIEERMSELLIEKGNIASAWLDGHGVSRQGEFEVTLGTLQDFLVSSF